MSDYYDYESRKRLVQACKDACHRIIEASPEMARYVEKIDFQINGVPPEIFSRDSIDTNTATVEYVRIFNGMGMVRLLRIKPTSSHEIKEPK